MKIKDIRMFIKDRNNEGVVLEQELPSAFGPQIVSENVDICDLGVYSEYNIVSIRNGSYLTIRISHTTTA